MAEAELDGLAAGQPPVAAPRGRAAHDDDALVGLSARNRNRGNVEEVRVDGLLAQIRLRAGNQRLTAVITSDAVKALRLRRGDLALAVIKSTEVMIAKPSTPPPATAARARSRA